MEDVLYTVQEVSKLIKTNATYVYDLIRKGYLPALKLGSYKVRRITLLNFLAKFEGKDLTNLDEVVEIPVRTVASDQNEQKSVWQCNSLKEIENL
jgi:excisionase family DNA binding protein